MLKISEKNVMRNEELGTWMNGISDPNAVALNNDLHRSHVLSLTSHPSPSTPFPLCGDNNVITDDKWMYDDDDDVDVDVLFNYFSRMNIFDEQGNVRSRARGHGVMDSPYAYTHTPFTPCSLDAHAHIHEDTGTPSSFMGVSVSSDLMGHTFGLPIESSLNQRRRACYGQVQQVQKPSSFASDRVLCSTRRPFAMDCDRVQSPFTMMQPKLALNVNTPSSRYFSLAEEKATRITANGEISQSLSPSGGEFVAFQSDSSVVVPKKDMICSVENGCNSLWGCRRNSHRVVPQIMSSRVAGSHIKNNTLAPDVSLDFGSLVEFQGYMYHMARDQNGCRFLQRMLDEGKSQEMIMVFNGVIDNVVELMMDPFGNYLVQKLLDVCRDDQRLQIVLMLTKEPGQLVKISSNTHGTRVVQKLIGTINSRKQISLVRSAIQSGFLDLIKDLNGNHVIQRCLQCFTCQDNEFIFEAAAKFCVDIATHQHGCCVLQRCIYYSMGKYQDKLVKEICKHGLLLAQDPFGNYVVQYIIEMNNPSASTKLLSQFKGNYVNLSMQKFSSHVVEKCLKHVAESRSRIVHELLSVPHFEQLLQDPYANYVVQRALGVTKGSLHASLVEAVCPHKILRTSPYCKRIFSRNLLKK